MDQVTRVLYQGVSSVGVCGGTKLCLLYQGLLFFKMVMGYEGMKKCV
jgi:hypothetical protein